MNKIILAQLSQMIAGFGDRFPDIEGAKGAFKLALASLSISEIDDSLVSEAIVNFICGKVPGHNNAFPPTPPQLCDEVNRLKKTNRNSDFVVLKRGDPIIKELERLRGGKILLDQSGMMMAAKAEIDNAMRGNEVEAN